MLRNNDTTDKIDKAFRAMPRINFLLADKKAEYLLDAPLSIGHGQTNSQPSTVRRMLEWLNPQIGDKILDIGSGSGWTTALLAYLVGATGAIYAVERIDQLLKFGKNNCTQIGVTNAYFFQAVDKYGLPEHAPYDRILVSAAANILPENLLRQLKVGGKMVVPVKNSILVINKLTNQRYQTHEYPGFVFVPLL